MRFIGLMWPQQQQQMSTRSSHTHVKKQLTLSYFMRISLRLRSFQNWELKIFGCRFVSVQKRTHIDHMNSSVENAAGTTRITHIPGKQKRWARMKKKMKRENETETNQPNRNVYTNIIVFLRGISAHKKIIVISIISPRREKRKEYICICRAYNSHS